MNKLLSVVIPVYNAAPYIEKCVLSLAVLAPLGLEVILVDDGSTDGSGEICDRLSEKGIKELPIRVMHQENQGVSVARNNGMAVAEGQWLWFVDADDCIALSLDEQGVKVLPQQLVNQRFVITDYEWEEGGESRLYEAMQGEVPYNLWRCWFRREIVNRERVRFVKGRRYAEDQEFILQFMLRAMMGNAPWKGQQQPLNGIVYHYTMRPGSAMTRKGTKYYQLRDIASVIMRLLPFMGRSWIRGEIRRLTKAWLMTLTR